MDRLRSLQVLRFLAALSVAVCHVDAILFGQAHAGAFGVDVFFVLSGFVITVTARANPTDFLKKRLIRVLPIYWALTAPALIIMGGLAPQRVIASLTLWPAYDVWTPPVLEVAWSLSFELVFYVATALVLAGVRARWIIGAWIVAGVLGPITGWQPLLFLGSPLVAEFLLGVGLALWGQRRTAFGGVALLAGLAVLGWFWVTGPAGLDTRIVGPEAWWRVLFWGVPAALIVYGALQFEAVFRARWAVPFVFLGEASYALYLLHVPLIHVVKNIAGGWAGAPILALALCVGAAAALYAYIERPMLADFRAKLLRPKAANAVTL